MSQSENFAWAIAFAWWPIFKMLSFLEYFVFFGAVFFTEQLYMISRMDFDMFFGVLIFEPKWGFCMGYSLCMMADFQNALISRRFVFFLERFFSLNNCKWFVEWMLTCFFGILIFEPKWGFSMGFSLCMMADFQNALISWIFRVFWSGFLHTTTLNDF